MDKFEDKTARLKFIDLVRYCKADIILTHNPEDYDPDHELTSKIINDIAVMIPVEKIKTPNKPYDKIPIIAYFEPVNGLGFVPTEYVDITDFEDGLLVKQGNDPWLRAEKSVRIRFGAENTLEIIHSVKNTGRGRVCFALTDNRFAVVRSKMTRSFRAPMQQKFWSNFFKSLRGGAGRCPTETARSTSIYKTKRG